MAAAVDDHSLLMAASTSYRLAHSGIRIDGTVPLDFARYPYVAHLIDGHWPQLTVLKGGQMGLSIAFIMKALEEAKQGGLRGIGYCFPTDSEVQKFAKARFGPMMHNNPRIWGDFVTETDSASLKRIGDTHLYFVGVGQRGSGGSARSKSGVKSMPWDRVYFDERDEMDESRVDAALIRVHGSLCPEATSLSTPTLPEYGVDMDYRKSDQSVWMWRCGRCNGWTCLEISYPDCIAEPHSAEPYYRCDKCGERLERTHGQPVARKTDEKDHHGLWVSQLCSPTRTAADIMASERKAIENGRRTEFENQVLARAYAEVDQQITREQLESLLTDEPRPLQHEGPAAMGVDPGKPHWYEVKIRISAADSVQVCRGRADSYEELSRVAKQYNVESGVMDMGYDPSAVAKFCEEHKGWYGCLYVNGKASDADWDHKERIVKVGRTRLLDDAHAAIVNKRTAYYRKDDFWTQQFVPQMTNLKRATIENDRTGDRKGVWVVTGGAKNDHLRHADAYCHLAMERCGLAKSVRRMERSMRKTYAAPRRSGVAVL